MKREFFAASVPLLRPRPCRHGATVIVFDFDGPPGGATQLPSIPFTDMTTGVSPTVTALRRTGPNFIPDSALVTRTRNGLGVSVSGFPNGQLDSLNVNEALVWTISGPVVGLRLEQIEFGAWEPGSDFQLYTDISANNGLFGPGLIPGPLNAFTPPNPWNPADDGVDPVAFQNFAIKVVPAGGREAFRISRMTFSTVLEPASLGLLVLGLAGVGVVRKRCRFGPAARR